MIKKQSAIRPCVCFKTNAYRSETRKKCRAETVVVLSTRFGGGDSPRAPPPAARRPAAAAGGRDSGQRSFAEDVTITFKTVPKLACSLATKEKNAVIEEGAASLLMFLKVWILVVMHLLAQSTGRSGSNRDNGRVPRRAPPVDGRGISGFGQYLYIPRRVPPATTTGTGDIRSSCAATANPDRARKGRAPNQKSNDMICRAFYGRAQRRRAYNRRVVTTRPIAAEPDHKTNTIS
ncbi:hypothetical protein EVAR_46071_1 [Eumeta japonica]|uniref:Uncharacterized protein n=1 Tax=Eumeta variegata TaxID=151549 RepID=A0A4C2A1T4_EUMVA|nr:hypothetical protein EVAR_46071_1 [Eumeta japonica]